MSSFSLSTSTSGMTQKLRLSRLASKTSGSGSWQSSSDLATEAVFPSALGGSHEGNLRGTSRRDFSSTSMESCTSTNGTSGTVGKRTNGFLQDNGRGVREGERQTRPDRIVTLKMPDVTRISHATRKIYISGWPRRLLRVLATLNFERLLFASFSLHRSREAAFS